MFNLIYAAAKAQDENTLNTLVEYTKDAIDAKEGFFTPAGFLARKGDIQAAEWLRLRGANVDQIAFAAAAGNLQEYALKLNQYGSPIQTERYMVAPARTVSVPGNYKLPPRHSHGPMARRTYVPGRSVHVAASHSYRRTDTIATVDWIAAGAAFGGHVEFAEELRTKHYARLSIIVEWAMHGSQYDYIKKLYEQAVIKGADFVSHTKNNNLFTTPEQILYTLSRIKNQKLREEIISYLSNTQPSPSNVPSILNKANLIHAIMSVHKLSYKQAYYYNNVEINQWFLLANHTSIGPDNVVLPHDITISIMRYISHGELSVDDAKKIYEKLFDRYYRLPTMRRFEKYVDSKGLFHWTYHSDRAVSLNKAVEQSGCVSTTALLLRTTAWFF